MGRIVLLGFLTFLVASVMSAASAQSQFKVEVPPNNAAAWNAQIAEHIARHLRSAAPALQRAYEAAGSSGPSGDQVIVRFIIEPSGQVGSTSVAKTSGHPALDEVAVKAVRQAAPYPPMPTATTGVSFLQPVTFNPLPKPSAKP